MAMLEHFCKDCGFWDSDNEHLLVCPNCASSHISNEPDEGVEDKHLPQDDL